MNPSTAVYAKAGPVFAALLTVSVTGQQMLDSP
jgi:hypothetical protein